MRGDENDKNGTGIDSVPKEADGPAPARGNEVEVERDADGLPMHPNMKSEKTEKELEEVFAR